MNEHHIDVWMAVAADHTRNTLHDASITRLARSTQHVHAARRAWLSRQTGRVLRGLGTQMVSLGRQLEYGCDQCVLASPEVKPA